MKPKLHIIAGPNGAGKTTFSGKFLPLLTQSQEFVNADNIARLLSPSNPQKAAFRAGREMLKRIEVLSAEKMDFSIETTLSGRSYVPRLRKLKSLDYEIHLFFLWLPDVQMAIDRVDDRVRQGGHDVPKQVIRRRYALGIRNLFQVYRAFLDSWTLFDNSLPVPYTIAGEYHGRLAVLDEPLFKLFSNMTEKGTDQSMREESAAPDWARPLMALRLAVAEVIEEHCRTGQPLIVWRDGKVYRQPPEEARHEMEQALKNDPWAGLLQRVPR